GRRRALADELVGLAVERGRVQLAGRVLGERRERRDLGRRDARAAAQLPVHRAQTPDPASAVVAVEVPTARRRDCVTPVDVTARDRAVSVLVLVGDDREDELPARVHLLAGREARAALPDAPAVVVQHPLLGGRAHVDLLPRVLADIADVEIAGRAVPREAPRVAQPVAGDLPLRPRLVHIQPEELAQANAQVLCAVPRVAARAAIAHAYIEQPVRPEL